MTACDVTVFTSQSPNFFFRLALNYKLSHGISAEPSPPSSAHPPSVNLYQCGTFKVKFQGLTGAFACFVNHWDFLVKIKEIWRRAPG